jgi:hypothetical protein
VRVSILMHRHDPPLDHYLMGALADESRRQGVEVDVHHGLRRPIRGDIVWLHVDLAELPQLEGKSYHFTLKMARFALNVYTSFCICLRLVGRSSPSRVSRIA